MKKKFLFAALFVAVAGGAFVARQNDNIDPDSLLAQNIEALGRGEDGLGCDWIITIYATNAWRCDRGGYMCCPLL